MTETPEGVVVTQEARNAAAEFELMIGRINSRDADNIRAGEWDATKDIQWFAKLLAHTPTLRGEEVERLVEVAIKADPHRANRDYHCNPIYEDEREKVRPMVRAIAAALSQPLAVDTGQSEISRGHAMQFQALLDDVPTTWRAHGYKSEAEEIADMANVGRALMEALPEGYSYMNCPSEIVSDLQNERDEALAATPAPSVSPDPAGDEAVTCIHGVSMKAVCPLCPKGITVGQPN